MNTIINCILLFIIILGLSYYNSTEEFGWGRRRRWRRGPRWGWGCNCNYPYGPGCRCGYSFPNGGWFWN